MTMSDTPLIKKLYDISHTPQTITDSNAMPLYSLTHFAAKNGIDDRHVKNISFFANVLGVSADLSGLGLIKQQLDLLIIQCCHAAGLGQQVEKELVGSIGVMRNLMRKLMLDEELKGEIDFFKLKRGYKSKTPLFAFHLSGATEADNILKANYQKWAFDINIFLRGIEKAVPERLEVSGRIMRYFLTSSIVEADGFCVEVVKSAIPEIATTRKWNPDTLVQYEEFVDKMMFGTLAPPKTRVGGYKRNAQTRRIVIDNIYVTKDEDDGKKKSRCALRINRRYILPEAGAREGESIDDYPVEEDILPSPSPFADKQTHRELPLSVLNYLPYTFHWDRLSLKPYEISFLFYFCHDEYDSPADCIVTRAFLESTLFLGLGLDDFIEIIIGKAKSLTETTSSKEENDGEAQKPIQLFFSPERGSLSYAIPEAAIGYYYDASVSQNCLPAGTIVELKLPESINQSFDDIIAAFRDERKGASSNLLFPREVRAKSHIAVKRFLRSFNARFEMNVSKESLTRSFKPYFQSRYGCDPICVSYASATLDASTRTQRFYSLIAPEVFHEEYYRSYAALKSYIYENLIEIARFDDTIVPVKSLRYLGKADKQPNADDLKEFAPIGSKVVPKMAALKEFFANITKMLESLSLASFQQRCDYHNLYTIFAYIVLQLGSGLRPVADPPINLEAIDFMGNLIYVADKGSRGRIVHIHLIVLQILKHLAVGARRTMELLCLQNSKNTKYQNRLFYFILPDFKAVEVTPERIRVFLAEHSLSGAYDYPLNCLRHLLRSVLPRRGAHSDLIDAVLGHQRYAKGLLDTYSTGSAESLRLAAQLIGDIIDELDIKVIKYRT